MLCRSIFFALPVINKSRNNLFWYPQTKFYTHFWVEHTPIEKVIALYMSAKLPKLHHHIFSLFCCFFWSTEIPYVQTFADSIQPDCKGCT